MAVVSNIARAIASAAAGNNHPVVDGIVSPAPFVAAATAGDVAVPEVPINGTPDVIMEHEVEMRDLVGDLDDDGADVPPPGMPLSKGALSGLDASAAITPSLLARDHLPGIMLGNGPRPIRYVMGELTHSVPGFSRIPPARARRLVVAALESRSGGGPDGNVAFFKTGWGRWDAQIINSCRDSGIGSFNDGHMSPSRSELSGYALSNGDSGVHFPRQRKPSGHRDRLSRGSWTQSSLREEDEDMDMLEHEADKMSLDGVSLAPSGSSTSDNTDDDDWAAAGVAALRQASVPNPGAPRWNYKAFHIPRRRPSRDWSRRTSANSQRPPIQSYAASQPSTSLPQGGRGVDIARRPYVEPALASPEEKAAVEALLSLGSR